MADYTYDAGYDAPPAPRNVASMANWAGAAVSLALVVGIGIWGYKMIARDVSGVPVVQAAEGPMRVAPEDPGGQLADHQGLAVNRVAGAGTAAPPADRLVLAPRPAGLAEEDVASGLLIERAQPFETRASLADEALQIAPDRSFDAMPEGIDTSQDAVRAVDLSNPDMDALVAQLTANAQPLSQLEAPVVPPVAALVDPQTQSAGLARSLRPRLRPSGLRSASLTAVAAPVAQQAPAAALTAAGGATLAAAVGGEIDPASLPQGTRLVQIGAFESPEIARTEWARMSDRFGDYMEGKSRVIQRATSGGRVFYRLRAHGFEDLADARRFCAAFVAGKVDCIPVVTR